MGSVEQSSSDRAPRGSMTHTKRHLLLTVGTNFAIMGLTVVSGTMSARLLGPSGRGELAAIQTIPSLLAAIAVLGLPSAVGYFTARNPNEARSLTVTAAIIALLAALPFMGIGYLMMPHALKSQSLAVVGNARLYLLYVAVQAVAVMTYVALQGLKRFEIWNALRIAPNAAGVLAVGTAWWAGSVTAESVARRFLVFTSCIIPIGYTALWRTSKSGTSLSRARATEMLRYGLPSALMLPAGVLNLQLDQLLMAAWLPSEILGLYTISVSWSGLLAPVFGALGSVIFPQLAATEDAEVRRRLIGRSLRAAVMIVILLGIGLAAVTPILLPLLFGKAFARAIPAALILVAGGMLLSLNTVFGEILRGVGAPRWPLLSQLAALPITVALLVVLLPRWSLVGASLSSVAAYLTTAVVCMVGTSRCCGLRGRDMLVPTAAELSLLKTSVRELWARTRR